MFGTTIRIKLAGGLLAAGIAVAALAGTSAGSAHADTCSFCHSSEPTPVMLPPDLQLTDVYITPTGKGGSASTSITVKNIGGGVTGPYTMCVWVDSTLALSWPGASLAGRAEATFTGTLTAANGAGTHTVKIEADCGHVVSEWDEWNNYRLIPIYF